MTTEEKRSSQTKKDFFPVKWTKSRLDMYFLGVPKFKIITSHKPLITMFNLACAKLLNCANVDCELVYEISRDAADPMDYLSRHPLPESDKNDTEKNSMLLNNEHGVVMRSIKEATEGDIIL